MKWHLHFGNWCGNPNNFAKMSSHKHASTENHLILSKVATSHDISLTSNLADHKGTFASNLKGAGARDSFISFLFFKNYYFIQQGCILTVNHQCHSKDIYNVKNTSILKKIYIYISSTTIFNIDTNKKCFFSILEGFLKDHVTLKTGVMMLKIQFLHHRNKKKKKNIP